MVDGDEVRVKAGVALPFIPLVEDGLAAERRQFVRNPRRQLGFAVGELAKVCDFAPMLTVALGEPRKPLTHTQRPDLRREADDFCCEPLKVSVRLEFSLAAQPRFELLRNICELVS
jgi:hypothetical protein